MIKVILLLCLAVFGSSATLEKCQALVIQAAGDQGAYEAGGIIGLIQNAQNGEAQWNVVTGVGVGAINAAIVSQYAVGQEAAAASKLQSVWSNFQANDWYKNWLAGPVQGLLVEKGIYNTKPAQGFLQDIIPNSPSRYIQVGAVDANAAVYVPFNNFNGALSASTLQAGVLASYAIAGVFPYVTYDNRLLINGAALKALDVSGAIEQCLDLNGNVQKNVFVDAVLINHKTWKQISVTDYNSLQMLLLTLTATSYKSTVFDLQRAEWDYTQVNFRYIVSPSNSLPKADKPLDYSKTQLQDMINQGINDAKSAIGAGAGVYWAEWFTQARTYLNSNWGTDYKLDKSDSHKEMVKMLKKAFAEEAARFAAEDTI